MWQLNYINFKSDGWVSGKAGCLSGGQRCSLGLSSFPTNRKISISTAQPQDRPLWAFLSFFLHFGWNQSRSPLKAGDKAGMNREGIFISDIKLGFKEQTMEESWHLGKEGKGGRGSKFWKKMPCCPPYTTQPVLELHNHSGHKISLYMQHLSACHANFLQVTQPPLVSQNLKSCNCSLSQNQHQISFKLQQVSWLN